ncbi:MAG: flagellin [Eubacterium sp.]
MIVQHNITSMNANRQLGIVGNNLAKSTEKLSSGYRINRAADDAAGLAISEKMRAQVRGLNRASDNAQDGISLIQTAEGAMDQQHAILQRTRELLVQASNSGVLDGTAENDFQKIQDEIDTLKSEYERINTDTEFNRKKLLDGSYKDQYLQLGANNAQGINVTIKTTAWDEKLYLSKTESTTDTAKDGVASTKGTTDGTVIENGTKYTYNSNIFTVKASYKTANGNGNKISQDEVDSLSATYNTAPDDNDKKILAKYGYTQDATGAGKLKTDIDTAANKSTAVTDVDGKAISGLLDNVDSMIKSVTTERSKLGAVQNRLEYTVKVDDNTAENLQSAESRIRDTDMADEMTRFSKESILQQAATSMLAQANQSNQDVLSLLQ